MKQQLIEAANMLDARALEDPAMAAMANVLRLLADYQAMLDRRLSIIDAHLEKLSGHGNL